MKSQKIRLYKEWNKLHFSKTIRDVFGALLDWNYIVEIKKEPKIRSKKQNNFYWHCLECLEKYSWSGYTADEYHEYFKVYFLWKQSKLNKNVTLPWSTANLTIEEFNQFMEKVLYFAKSEYGIEQNDLYKTYYDNNILHLWPHWRKLLN